MKKVVVTLVVLATACSTPLSNDNPSETTQEQSEATGGESGGTSSQSSSATTGTNSAPTGVTCWATSPEGGNPGIQFVDDTEVSGLVAPLVGMHGHAAIWTDSNADDQPDLFVGTFADRDAEVYQHRGADGPSPDQFLTNSGSEFGVDTGFVGSYSRSSGGASADLDNDGDLDLVVARNIKDGSLGETPTTIFQNVDGQLSAVEDSGIPDELGGRAVGVFDYDGDGRYDLFIAEDRWTGGSSVLLRNEGEMHFADVTSDAGLPRDLHGLGVAVADFNNDGSSDLFVSGSNRMFFSDEEAGFREQDSSVFEWEYFSEEDDVAGASVADVNRDGWLDLALGQHFNSTVEDGLNVSVRLYLNQGDGTFADVTAATGLVPLPTKAPHVELNDLDNDGWPDLLTTASADAGPAVFKHEGLEDGVPTFAAPAGLGDTQYWVGGPTADYDLDGRLDVFLVEWEPSLPSLLLRNDSISGNWLEVSVDPAEGHGVGWRVEVYDGDNLVGARDITVSQGYSAGVLPIAHFGLGDLTEVSVRLTPPRGEPVQIDSVPANQHIRWPAGCS